MRLIVLNIYSRNSLAIVKSLAEDVEIIGGAINRSKYFILKPDRYFRHQRVGAIFRHADPKVDWEGFVRDISDACRDFSADGVIASGTSMTNYLSEAKATIEGMSGTRVLVEDYEKLKALSDKWHTYKIAVRLGIPAPKSVLLDGSEAMRVGIDSLNFPVVAKPRVSYAAIGVKFFETREQFQAWLASDGCLNGDYLVQERVDGELHDVTACAQEGRAVSVLSQKRLKSLYDFGGGGVVNITTDEPKAREYAVRIINEVGWNGPIEFDFILAADGDFYLLECNPKIWGTTYLTVRAGMNIVQQTVDVYMKEGALPAVREYQVGLLYRWLFPECLFNWIQKPRTMKNVARRIAETYRGYDAQHIESNINMADIPHLLGMVFDRAQL